VAERDVEQFIRDILTRAKRKALSLTNHMADSEDIAQRVAIKAAARLSRNPRFLDRPGKRGAWVLSVVSRMVLDRWRIAKRAANREPLVGVEVETIWSRFGSDTEAKVDTSLRRTMLDVAVAKLTRGCRDVINLKLDGLTREEIAVERGVSIKTVDRQFADAMYALREYFETNGIGKQKEEDDT
jgi:RNA polymerase sigma factor (sigma-70 family)